MSRDFRRRQRPIMYRPPLGTDALLQVSDIYGGVAIAADNARAARLYERLGTESRYDGAEYIDQGYGVYDI